jgi:hypothetical protein
LALLLVLSLGIKASGNITAGDPAPGTGSPVVASFLQQNGFSVDPKDPANAMWVSGSNGPCKVEVADISPDGYQRDAVMEYAAGRPLSYVFAGSVYTDQPVVLTNLHYYWERLKRYLRLPSHDYPVRAVTTSSDCSAEMLKPEKISGLSQ